MRECDHSKLNARTWLNGFAQFAYDIEMTVFTTVCQPIENRKPNIHHVYSVGSVGAVAANPKPSCHQNCNYINNRQKENWPSDNFAFQLQSVIKLSN